MDRLKKLLCLLVFVWSCGSGILSAGDYFDEFYGDFIASNLLGFSSYANLKAGLRHENFDYYGFATYDWADTTGTDLPYQYRFQGATAGIEARYWFPGRAIRYSAGYGFGLSGDVKNRNTFKTGFAGYKSFEKQRSYSDIYGELMWNSRADDLFLNIRYRPGRTLRLDQGGRLWTYGILQVLASGKGDIGNENRAETGVGLGYIFFNGTMSANMEIRGGHSFSGTIKNKSYFNPMFILSAGF